MNAIESPKAMEAKRIGKLIDLHLRGVNAVDIGKVLDMPASTVKFHLAKLKEQFPELSRINRLEPVKRQFLSVVLYRVLEFALSPDNLSKAGFCELVKLVDILQRAIDAEEPAGPSRAPTAGFVKAEFPNRIPVDPKMTQKVTDAEKEP